MNIKATVGLAVILMLGSPLYAQRNRGSQRGEQSHSQQRQSRPQQEQRQVRPQQQRQVRSQEQNRNNERNQNLDRQRSQQNDRRQHGNVNVRIGGNIQIGHNQQRNENGRRMDRDRYRENFGENHRFRFHAEGRYPHFFYGGYNFFCLDPYPLYWGEDNDVYVFCDDYGNCYLENVEYPGILIRIEIQ